ncbi:helix-turn-helix domain-containing protein [Bacillus sp. REN16]|uniref:helix-turn-helix domain-containing protein n=1 Tax=Bacillus sp. REN16 TaxID=2887296 RepID=UPI001E2A7E5A|nr:AraC family transcriptional regulator [Bacillus sp. REN16]MCC3355897.1 AraC family transcriptional regulator [Bacillus sp. REN16]
MAKKIKNKLMQLQWKGIHHRNSFILILFIASIPGLITGLGIYWFAIGQVEDELMNQHNSQINERAKNIDEQFSFLEYSTSHWAFEPRFGDALRNMDFVKQFTETYDITKSLLLLQGSHSLIKDVELYVEADKPILFNSEYNVLNNKSKEYYHELLTNDKTMQWVRNPQSNGKNSSPLAFVHNIPATSKDPFGLLVVKIDQQKGLELLKTLTPYSKGATFILNEDNQILLSANNTKDPSFIAELRRKLEDLQEDKGTFQFNFDNKMYSVSYGHFTRIDSNWTYVSAAPISSITAPLVFISRLILIISVSTLILALIMSWFASNKIYSPINGLLKKLVGDEAESLNHANKNEFLVIEEQWRKLAQNSNLLRDRLSEQVIEIKRGFILELIQGYFYEYQEDNLRKRMENYGWNVHDRSFIALEIQLTGLDDSNERFSNNDESLVTFVTANIMEEIAQELFEQFNVIKVSDLSVEMLVIFPKNTSMREELRDFASKVTDGVNRILKMQVTATISDSTDKVKEIPYLFEEVRKRKRFRIFENRNQIIDLHENKKMDMQEFHYPFTKEKEIIQAIRMGHINEVEELISQFFKELTKNGNNEININYSAIQLFSSIQHEILHSGFHPHDLYKEKNMYEELSKIRDKKSIVKWFIDEVINPYLHQLEGRMNIELKRLIEKVIVIIHENYKYDISLESCADEVGTNPYSLSKSFKQIVGINFIDYLTQLRIEKAKEMLQNSDMKINHIAETVGYRQSYFNRIFKKQIGVTPSQYRKLNQQNSEIG